MKTIKITLEKYNALLIPKLEKTCERYHRIFLRKYEEAATPEEFVIELNNDL